MLQVGAAEREAFVLISERLCEQRIRDGKAVGSGPTMPPPGSPYSSRRKLVVAAPTRAKAARIGDPSIQNGNCSPTVAIFCKVTSRSPSGFACSSRISS